MKQRIILIGIIALFTSTLNGQELNIGAELGSNIIPIEKTDLGRNFQMGTYAGLNVRYNVFKNFSVSSGLFFSQRKKMYFSSDTTSILSVINDFYGGTSPYEDSSNNNSGIDMNVYKNTRGIATENYIELPLLVSYSIKKISISAGPYIGFLMNGKKKEVIRTTTPLLQAIDIASFDSTGFLAFLLPPADETIIQETSSIDNLKRFAIGSSFGVGYMMENVTFNLNYTLGFNDYRIDKGIEDKSVHTSIRVSICYFFRPLNKDNEPSL